MFGKAKPPIIPLFGVLREVERIAKCVSRLAALVDRRKVQN
ncbi:hypothetical protein M2175_003897 [Bradyrhizobium elkanii]|nr:hypothetical protein [Bradyrhizobium elkanii]MCS3969420.1 hypothetical protein [Bradyrhizobium japonicum]